MLPANPRLMPPMPPSQGQMNDDSNMQTLLGQKNTPEGLGAGLTSDLLAQDGKIATGRRRLPLLRQVQGQAANIGSHHHGDLDGLTCREGCRRAALSNFSGQAKTVIFRAV